MNRAGGDPNTRDWFLNIAEDSQKAPHFIPEKHGESEFFVHFVKNPSNHTAFLMTILVNFGRAGNILFPLRQRGKIVSRPFPKIHKSHKNTEYIPNFS